MFSIFTQSNYSFDDKRPNERVVLFLYRHWFVLTIKLVVFVILALLPILLFVLKAVFIRVGGLNALFWFFASLYYLVWWQGLFYAITMYLLDTWIVTDQRVLDNEQHGFFDRTVSELHIGKIQDISVEVEGIIPTFLDFGDLEIQTAGTVERFHFKQIPHPRDVKDRIMQAHNDYVASHKGEIVAETAV